MLITLAAAIPEMRQYVDDGTCNATKITATINDCVQRLLDLKNWKYSLRPVEMHPRNDSLTLPREFERIVAYALNGTPRPLFSKYYRFLEGGFGTLSSSRSGAIHRDLVDLGEGFCTFYDIDTHLGETRRLLALSTEASDVGKTLTVYGRGEHDLQVLTSGEPGKTIEIIQWQGGVDGTLPITPLIRKAMPATGFKDLTSIVKPITKGYVTLYAVDVDALDAADTTTGDPIFWFLGKYHPQETSPSYRRYKLMAPDFTHGACINALVKVQYVPAVNDGDVLLVQNMPALKFMAQAVALYRNGEPDKGVKYAQLAERELMNQLRSDSAGYADTVNFQVDAWSGGEIDNLA